MRAGSVRRVKMHVHRRVTLAVKLSISLKVVFLELVFANRDPQATSGLLMHYYRPIIAF